MAAESRAASFACALLLAITASPALADPQRPSPASLRDLTLEELGNIEVTSVSKQPAEVWRSPAAIAVLTPDDIRRSGATSLPELLRLVAGVQVSRLDSNHWAVGVRGLASAFSKSLLVLIDGRSVYTPLFGGVFWNVQDTVLEDIERIEVIRGPGGTIWGANAVNGVVNVITRNSRDTTGSLVTLGGGSVDQGRAGARVGGRRDALAWRVYGSGFLRSSEEHHGGRPFDEWRLGQAGFRVDASPSPRDSVTVQGDVYTGRAGDRLGLASFSPPGVVMIDSLDRVRGGNVLTRWQRDSSGGNGLRIQAYVDHTGRDAAHYSEARTTVDVDLLQHRQIGRHHLSLGAGARISTSNFTPRFSTLALEPEDQAHRLASAYAQDEMALVADTAWLTVGSKFEHNNFTGLEVQPSARVLWRLTRRQSVWAAVTRAVRIPSRIDTDLRSTTFLIADPLAYVQVRGVADFEAERVIGVEAGYRRLITPRVYLDVAAFHNDHDRLAGFGAPALSMQTSPVNHLQLAVDYDNALRGTTDGFEVAPDWRVTEWLQVNGAYSFLTIDMRNRPGFTDINNVTVYEGTSPRHQGFVRASLTLPRRIEIDHSYRFAGRIPVRQVPGYVTADARIGWQAAKSVMLAIAGRNLLQPDHPEFFRDEGVAAGIRRNVYASVTWTP